MKVVLVANISANGKVLLAENPKHQAPTEALGFFVKRLSKPAISLSVEKPLTCCNIFPTASNSFSRALIWCYYLLLVNQMRILDRANPIEQITKTIHLHAPPDAVKAITVKC